MSDITTLNTGSAKKNNNVLQSATVSFAILDNTNLAMLLWFHISCFSPFLMLKSFYNENSVDTLKSSPNTNIVTKNNIKCFISIVF